MVVDKPVETFALRFDRPPAKVVFNHRDAVLCKAKSVRF